MTIDTRDAGGYSAACNVTSLRSPDCSCRFVPPLTTPAMSTKDCSADISACDRELQDRLAAFNEAWFARRAAQSALDEAMRVADALHPRPDYAASRRAAIRDEAEREPRSPCTPGFIHDVTRDRYAEQLDAWHAAQQPLVSDVSQRTVVALWRAGLAARALFRTPAHTVAGAAAKLEAWHRIYVDPDDQESKADEGLALFDCPDRFEDGPPPAAGEDWPTFDEDSDYIPWITRILADMQAIASRRPA